MNRAQIKVVADAAARNVEIEALKKDALGTSADKAAAAVAVEVTAAVEVAAAAAERNDLLTQLQAERASDEPDLKKLKRLGNELRAREKQAREAMVAEVREEPPTKPVPPPKQNVPTPFFRDAAHILPTIHIFKIP